MARRSSRMAARVLAVAMLGGCAGTPVIQTQLLEVPVAVPCRVETPAECSSAYAVDRVSAKDDALAINRALRVEIEERAACEVRLLAAVKGCNGAPRRESDPESGHE
ncbi:hypothetical protein [Nitrosovibrio sp. Nv17]|uniref:hypothetical protein n=1 Tax=Nitrosovibrio sp. Nv17 TaxID=1855339 RepID=UPI000908FC81|nr:hypothetical protein [Nitrosovibrio sp. Nv17]SFW21712.1 hypothetical protein SAMN05216414_10696 [Nitrosovibrio sp. Nv17]